MIIAIDFDGTIVTDAYPLIGSPLPLSVETIQDLYEDGNTLILWTCREGIRLAQALAELKRLGIYECFEFVNENADFLIDKHGNDCRKIGADMYIDDKAIGWNGWHAVRDAFWK